MPKCKGCKESVPSDVLLLVNDGAYCPDCRQPKLEGKMAETTDKNLATVKFDEVEAKGRDGRDHRVSAEVNYNGLQLNLKVTFDQIRDFFSKKKSDQAERKLKAVP